MLQVLGAEERFSTFFGLLRSSGIDSVLADEGPYTVLAPTNRAFDSLGRDTLEQASDGRNLERLRAALRSHILRGRWTASELVSKGRVQTLEGRELKVGSASGRWTVGSALVADADLAAGTGIIHALDSLIAPSGDVLLEPNSSDMTDRKGGPDAWWW
jgi:uncharacterized surface protein with fasciclin (FAS1) repeats